jgi:hypothetical protein
MKHSVQLFAFLFLAFPVFTSCVFSNRTPIYGNHQLVNQRINIDNYEKVILSIPAEVFYQQFSDSTPYLQIHTDENIFKALDVKVENNQLIIDVKKDSIIRPSQLTIYTCSYSLNQVAVAGSGKMCMKGEVNAKEFQVNITGSGNLLADSLLCEKINAAITGSGSMQLTGASNQSSFAITGSGNIHAFDYLVQELNCGITGSGDIEALVTKQLNVKIVGSGNLSYRGNPESVDRNISGSGKVQPVN